MPDAHFCASARISHGEHSKDCRPGLFGSRPAAETPRATGIHQLQPPPGLLALPALSTFQRAWLRCGGQEARVQNVAGMLRQEHLQASLCTHSCKKLGLLANGAAWQPQRLSGARACSSWLCNAQTPETREVQTGSHSVSAQGPKAGDISLESALIAATGSGQELKTSMPQSQEASSEGHVELRVGVSAQQPRRPPCAAPTVGAALPRPNARTPGTRDLGTCQAG